MDRLTIKLKLPPKGTFRTYTPEQSEEIKRANDISPEEIYRRLQEYEDTGLSPDEVTALKADNKRLHTLLDEIEVVLGKDEAK